MEFRMLGPLEVTLGGVLVEPHGPRQRGVLAALLLHPNEPRSSEQLIRDVWGDDAPDTAESSLYVHVSKLRKLLGGDERGILLSKRPGYVLHVEPDRIDAHRFERLVQEGSRALEQGLYQEAAARLREGLSLWRGSVLGGLLVAPSAQSKISQLEELRLRAVEDSIEAEFALGRHARLVPELEGFVAEHPLRERLRGQLMLALYRSGRQAEALEEFQRLRHALVDGLGIEPSPTLKALQAAILRQDPSLGDGEVGASERDGKRPTRSARKTVTALFVGLATPGEDGDPERRVRRFAGVIEEARGLVHRHGGRVLEAADDKLLAAFGLVRSREDDALRALRAAVELRSAVEEAGDDVVAAIGVETGAVLLRSDSEQPAVAGEVLGVVTRLAYSARPGDVVVGQATRALAGHALRLTPARKLHGGERMWRLRELAADAPTLPVRALAPLVGRTQELAQLLQVYDRAVAERTSYLVTILGSAGIGKSRLAAELRARVSGDASVFTGRCPPYGEGITFWPLAEIVRQAVGKKEPEALARRLADDEQGATIAEHIAGALGTSQSIEAQAETFWAVRRFLEKLAQAGPVVLLLEDLHWAEATFLDLIDHIADWSRSAPLLLVCLARPELLDSRADWGGGKPNAVSMLLEPLSQDESAALVGHLVESSAMETDNRTRIVQAAGGNPLFIEELVRATVESGDAARQLTLPPTIQAVLSARLDQLEPDDRAVLEVAAVIGNEFRASGVVELAGVSPAALSERLRVLVRKDLVRPHDSPDASEDVFRFRHLLIHDSVYDSIPKERRAELHEQFADCLERAAGERLGEYEEILGFHLGQATRFRAELGPPDESDVDLAARAARHLIAGGRRAHARADTPAEIALLSRAAELLPANDRGRIELLPELGDALREIGDFTGAHELLDEAEASASDDPALAAYVRVIRLRLEMQTDPSFSLERAADEAERAVSVLEERGDERRLAKGWELRAWLPYLRCRAAEAEEALLRTVEYARAAGDGREEARALSLLFATAVFGPLRVEQGIERCEEVLQRPALSKQISASATRALASLKAMRGEFEEARMLLATDRAISEELGQPLASARASAAYGFLELLADDADAATAELRSGYERLKDLGETGALSNVAAVLAQALFLTGRHDEAYKLTGAAKRSAAPGDLSAQVYWRGPRAKVLAVRGRFDEAAALACEAVELARRTDFLNMQGDALADAAEVFSLSDRHAEAAAMLRKAVHAYDRKGNRMAARRARGRLSDLSAGALAP